MKILSVIGILLSITGATITLTNPDEENYTEEAVENTENDFGSEGALEDEEYTLEEMLIYALEDEYRAREEYIYIMNEFNVTNPFSNIKESEETHIDLLLPLFDAYGIDPVDPDVLDHIIPAETLTETYEVGVIAEINNIDMYNKFLEQELPEDVRDAFIKLRDASYNHLSAFERQLESNVSGTGAMQRGKKGKTA